MTQTLSDALRSAPETSSFLHRSTQLFRDRLSTSAPFDLPVVRCELQDSLHRVESAIFDFSQSTIHQLNIWDQSFLEIDTELNEFEGLFQRVKSETASSLVGVGTSNAPTPEEPSPPLTYPDAPFLKFPETPFDVNTTALEGVGHQLPDVEAAQQKTLPPLIRKIQPGSPFPTFWTSPSDFFSPAMSVMLTTDDSAYGTSFSAFYGFNPVPAVVLEQKKLIKQSMGKTQ